MSKRLIYAETAKCPCGERLAYRHGEDAWDCSAILRGEAVPSGEPGAVQHTDRLPFVFYKIKPERSGSASSATSEPGWRGSGERGRCDPRPGGRALRRLVGGRLVVALVTWRLANLAGFILWLACVPAAAVFGWYHSLPFVALASIYANAIRHLAAWRADVPNEGTR